MRKRARYPSAAVMFGFAAVLAGQPVQAAAGHADFNDLVGGVLAGQAGGDGLSATWGNSTALEVVAGDLTAPAATGLPGTQSGMPQSVQSQSGAAVQSTRALATPLTGTVWFSFLLQQPNAAARGGLTFNSNAASAAVVPRVVAVGGSIFIDYGTDAQDRWISNVLTLGQTALVVGRIELDVADGVDRLSVWVDPDVAELGAADAVLEGNDAFGPAVTRIGVTSYQVNGAVGGIVDRVAIADGPFAYAEVTGAAPAEYALTLADEFDAPGLDAGMWQLDAERSNVDVAGGLLRLVTTEQETGWHTGKITSYYTQRFGYYAARYRIGADSGLNNAFWLSTAEDVFLEPGGTPQNVDRTEVDINETHYPDILNMTLHDWAPGHTGLAHDWADVNVNLSESFHTYAFEWRTDNSMTWYFDGVTVYSATPEQVNRGRSSLPLAVLFSTKVLPFAGEPGPNLDGTSMDVDWVRVYQKPGWTGAASGMWPDPANWGPDGVPGTDGAAVFNGPTAHPAVTLDADAALREVYIAGADTPGITLAAGHALQLGDVTTTDGVGSITLNSDVTTEQVIAAPIVGLRDLILANYSRAGGSLVLAGGVDGAAAGRIVQLGGGDIVVAGEIGANVGDVVNFAGARSTLASANLHTGVTDVRGGVLTVTADGALGIANSAGPTRVAEDAALALAGGVHYTLAEPLYVAGDGAPVADGALTVADDTATAWNTNVWLTGNATLSSGQPGGALTIGGQVNSPDATSRQLTLAGEGTLVLNGSLGNRIVGLRKSGGGAAILNSSINLYAGTTTVEAGTLALGANATTGQSPLVDVQAGAAFDVSARSAGYTVAAGRVLRVNGVVAGDVILASGARLEGEGILQGAVTVQSGATVRVGPDAVVDQQTVALTPTADVRIRWGEPATPQGADHVLAAGPVAAGDAFRTLLDFSLTDIPADAALVGNPALTLTSAGEDDASAASTPQIELRRLLTGFVESEATWLERSAGAAWASAGGDLGTLLSSTAAPDADTFTVGSTIRLSGSALTSNLRAALGSASWPVILKTDSETSGQRSFFWLAQRESATPPVLSITWGRRSTVGTLTCAGGLVLASGARLEFEPGAAGDQLIVAGGVLSVPAGGVTLAISGLDASTNGVFTLMDWRAAQADEVAASDFTLDAPGLTAELRIVDDRLLLVMLPEASRFDFNGDGVVDAADAATFVAALSGPLLPPAPEVTTEAFVRADHDADGDVDLQDFAALQRWLTGAQ